MTDSDDIVTRTYRKSDGVRFHYRDHDPVAPYWMIGVLAALLTIGLAVTIYALYFT